MSPSLSTLTSSAQHPSACSLATHSTTSYSADLKTTLTVLMCPSVTLRTLHTPSRSPPKLAELQRLASSPPSPARSNLSHHAWRRWNATSPLPTSLFQPIFHLPLTCLSQSLHTRKLPGRSTCYIA